MINYERYSSVKPEEYGKKGVMYYLCRKPSDKKIIPIISRIKNKKVLEVGFGTGYYTTTFIKNKCKVTGVDINPHLGKNLRIKIIKAKADKFSNHLKNEKFDVVASFWMTEYLDENQLEKYLKESKKVLKKEGKLITTIISNRGLGWFYVILAMFIRKIRKYGYKNEAIRYKIEKSGFKKINLIKLNSWLGVPWAYLIIAK